MIRGGNGIADGHVDDSNVTAVIEGWHKRGFGHSPEANARYQLLPKYFCSACICLCLVSLKNFLLLDCVKLVHLVD